MAMKGQMFIIIAIVVVTVLVLLKSSINTSDILRSRANLESDLAQLELADAASEEKNNLQVNYLQNMSMMNNVYNFTNFTQVIFASNAQTFNAFVVGSYVANATAGANASMNVTVANFLGKSVNANLTFSYNNAVANFTSLADKSSASQNFTFNAASSTSYYLLVSYGSGSTSLANITIPVSIGNQGFVGFYDLSVASSTGTYGTRFQQNVTLAAR